MIVTNNQYIHNIVHSILCLSVLVASFEVTAQEDRTGLTDICDGEGYLSTHQSGGDFTNLWRININETNVTLDLLAQYQIYFNAIGFNAETASFYGAVQGTPDIVRLQADGFIEVIHSEPSIGGWNALAGDCNFNGKYLVFNRDGRAFLYNVDPFTLESEFALEWHTNTGIDDDTPLVFADIVFDPQDPSWVYAFHGRSLFTGGTEETKGWLIRFNVDPAHPDFGLMQKVMEIPETTLYGIGAMFFGADLGLYVYGREDGTTDNNTLFRIDLDNEEARIVKIGPGARNVDGCSCLSGIRVSKTVKKNPVECGEDAIFNLQVEWYGRNKAENIVVKDTIEYGDEVEIIFQENWDDATVEELPNGSYVVTLRENEMPQHEVRNTEIRITGLNYGEYCNQAYVYGTFAGRNFVQPSDDPTIDGWHDETCFLVGGIGDIEGELDWTATPSCPNGGTGTVTLEWEGFEAGQRYIIYPFNDTVTGGDGQVIWNEAPAGTYTINEIGETGDSCTYNVTLEIDVPSWTAFEQAQDTTICEFDDLGMYAQNTEIEIHRWRPLGQVVWYDGPVSIPSVRPRDEGQYEVEFETEGCTWRDTFQLGVAPPPTASYIRDYTGIEGQPVQIMAESLPNNIVSWNWIPPTGLSCPTCPEPKASDEDQETYIVRFTGENGCSDTIQVRIDWLESGGVYIPNSFTPNNDGINDIYTVYPSEWVLEFEEAEIFNRWGDRVYHSMGRPKWDGRFNGKHVDNGVYVLVLKYRTLDQQLRVIAGDITITR